MTITINADEESKKEVTVVITLGQFQAMERVISAAKQTWNSFCEFDGDGRYCGESFDHLGDALEAFQKTEKR